LLRMGSGMRSDFSIQNNANYGGSKGVAKHLFSDMPTAATKPPCDNSKNVRKTLSAYTIIRKPQINGFPLMLVGYMRVSSESDRQITDLQRDALLAKNIEQNFMPNNSQSDIASFSLL
jgi:hypothetical protein